MTALAVLSADRGEALNVTNPGGRQHHLFLHDKLWRVVLRDPGRDCIHWLNHVSPGIDPDSLDHLRRSGIWEKFVTAAGNGSVRIRIYFGDLGHLKFELPSMPEQKKIAAFLNTGDHEIDFLREQLEALKQQKKGLMQKLLTGEVRVKLPEGVV